ncbi:putative Zn-dependent peptidase [Propionibacteriaceae bacterium ES.041]|uniref:M16 family metallopeptidase n=1 Tax=Enemella evansiae TaxID=2016499 RepID=UPI000C0161B7|nr:pitrilysin family protein [Enemella evansiae]PFG66721.1 putative Zn-dependent peptidase [Propionibacteriaceae bacterium ES.041]
MASSNRAAARQHYLGGNSRRSVLPGGLRVVTEDMPGTGSFSIGCFVGTGSRFEAPRLHGVSHFLEHVLFKGTRRRGAEEISAAIEQVGGDLNAYTAKEHTCFYAKTLADDAPIAVDVLTDMLSASLLREADIDAERAVILDEIAMHHDDPADAAGELVASRLFAGTPLERSVIGSDASISALSRDQINSFWRRHYRAPRIVVAAAGRVDHDRLVDQLAEFDERLAGNGDQPRQRPARPKIDPGSVLVRSRPLEHALAVLGFPSPGVFTDGPGSAVDQRRYPLNLLSVVLGGGMSSRLFVEVRERRGLAYAIDAGESAYADAGSFTIEWGSVPERVADVTAVVRGSLAELLENGIGEAELARARGQLLGQTLLAFEGPTARMNRLGTAELSGDARRMSEILEHYEQVTPDELAAVAEELLTVPPVLSVVGGRVNRNRLTGLVERWL